MTEQTDPKTRKPDPETDNQDEPTHHKTVRPAGAENMEHPKSGTKWTRNSTSRSRPATRLQITNRKYRGAMAEKIAMTTRG